MFIKTLFLFLFLAQGFGLTKREIPESLTVSVIIPCSGYHFQHLNTLLDIYQHQTCLPDEVVISLSSMEELDPLEIDALETHPWPFPVKIYKAYGKQSAGLNRNIAASRSTGDILVLQDADDLPHPQRVEIAKFVFENYFVDHLIHMFTSSQNKALRTYDKNLVPFITFESFNAFNNSPSFHTFHNGNICCSRRVVETFSWEDVKSLEYDLDIEFNRNVYQKFPNTAIVPWPLVTYRRELSTFYHYFPHLFPPL